MPRRQEAERLRDILAAIDRIKTYVGALNYEAFSADARTSDAVQYNFVIIGEAANHLPRELTESRPELPWAEMRALRNYDAGIAHNPTSNLKLAADQFLALYRQLLAKP